MRTLRPILFLAVIALFVQPLTGCSDDDDSQPNVADDAGDTGADISGGEDAGSDAAGGEDTSADAGGDATGGGDADTSEGADAADGSESGLPQTCEGDCLVTALSLEYAGETGALSRAGFGLTAPAASESGEWEVYLEAWEGGFEGCPTQNSASPDWQFIIGGFGILQDATTLTKADDGVFLTLLDYDGKFLGLEPSARSTVTSITPVAMRIDTDRVADGIQDEEGFIALDISAIFGETGETSGHLYARHCVSMDVLE